ncbi:MAG: aminotransferase class V-fold PLP-dependent enzyme [Chloroflexi bacterium]|nr:aminotransferase class V-fold PLP-dependent enzyme [Chloroflexota bacterium]
MLTVQALRDMMPITKKGITYLNTGWDSPSPRPVLDAIKAWLDYEAEEGPTSPPVMETKQKRLGEVRAALASLLNATADEVAFMENTTEGVNVILNGFPWQKGDELLTTNLEHGSGIIPAYLGQKYHGFTTKIVNLTPQDDAATILKKFEAGFTPKTKLVSVSHIMFTTGLVIPLKELCTLAHSKGAYVLADAAQSYGHLVLDLRDANVDFFAFPGHKWLLGPDGTGGLYIRKDLIPMIFPAKSTYPAMASFDYAGHFTPKTDVIRKFELTTRSTANYLGMEAAIKVQKDFGIKAVYDRILELSDYTKRRLSDIPGTVLNCPTSRERSCGLVSFAIRGVDPDHIFQQLWQRGRVVARTVHGPDGLRMATHIFNTTEELDRALDIISDLAREAKK